FPFGHRASFVETYERRFEFGDAPVEVLRGPRSLVITEPARDVDVAERQFPVHQVDLDPFIPAGFERFPARRPTAARWGFRGGCCSGW
ncbi:hypothetical protein VM98_34490, partial [Streptomyces rubellomurinus subsp. indigoferus]